MKRIIYPTGDGVAVIIPADCGLTIEQIAAKDVPVGAPYRIINTIELPDRENRDSWAFDFSTPDGYGGDAPF